MKAYIERPISEKPEKVGWYFVKFTYLNDEIHSHSLFCNTLGWMEDIDPNGVWLQPVEIPDPSPVVNTDVLVKALERITEPIKYMRSDLKDGEQLNGQYAIQLSNDPEYLKGIAREALSQFTTPSADNKEEKK